MGQAFSGPNAFKFFGFTPKATAVLQANPLLFVTLVLVLISCVLLGLGAYWIHYETNKVYAKPKSNDGAKR